MLVHIETHPLIKHKLGLLRDRDISTKKFRELSAEIAHFLTYKATANLPLENKVIDSWAGTTTVQQIKGKKITIVPILRAGIGMMNGVIDIIPSAKISVVGFYRDEKTLKAVKYFEKFAKSMSERVALILDPMLATGSTLIATIDALKTAGCKQIKGIFLVAAPEGVAKVEEVHPDVEIYVASLDEKLNELGYILPGLGDAGDKIFGTK